MIKEPESMREIHEIMEKLHKRREGKSGEDILREIRDTAELAGKKYGLHLHKVKRGILKAA